MTEWKQVAEFPDYEVSEHGTIRRLTDSNCAKRGKVLRPKIDKYGYLVVRPFRDGRGRYMTVHRLVAMAWYGPMTPPYTQVAHHDGNHTNNHYSNLRWATAKENHDDRERHGRVVFGARHWRTKLTVAQTDELIRRYHAGMTGAGPRIYQYQLAKEYGVNQAYVSSLTRGKFKRRASA